MPPRFMWYWGDYVPYVRGTMYGLWISGEWFFGAITNKERTKEDSRG